MLLQDEIPPLNEILLNAIDKDLSWHYIAYVLRKGAEPPSDVCCATAVQRERFDLIPLLLYYGGHFPRPKNQKALRKLIDCGYYDNEDLEELFPPSPQVSGGIFVME